MTTKLKTPARQRKVEDSRSSKRKAKTVAGRPRQEPEGDDYEAKFAKHLGKLLDASGLTADELAERLDVSAQAVWHWLSGRRTPPLKHFPQIAKALKVKRQDLLP